MGYNSSEMVIRRIKQLENKSLGSLVSQLLLYLYLGRQDTMSQPIHAGSTPTATKTSLFSQTSERPPTYVPCIPPMPIGQNTKIH